MGTPGVDGGGVFSAPLTNQLVETMAEVVYRTGAQGTGLLVGLVVRVVLAVVVVPGVPAHSQRPPEDPVTRVWSRPRQTGHQGPQIGGRHSLEGNLQPAQGGLGGRRW